MKSVFRHQPTRSCRSLRTIIKHIGVSEVLLADASMAASSLSVVPPSSLSFITERSHSYSSSSSFVIGGNHKRFTSLHSWHSISPSRLNARVSAKRGAGPVITASGDYYVTLGVPNSASSKEIKAAYRRLARQVLHLVQFLDFFPIIFFWFCFC